MIPPEIAPSLPADVWRALQTITGHIDSLPVVPAYNKYLYTGVEELTEKLVQVSKQHQLKYPIGG